MRHDRLWTTLTLLGATINGSFLWADTPVKPAQASFTSTSAASRIPATQTLTVSEAEKLVQLGELPAVVEKKVTVDYTVKAASIEVAWLQDAATYPLHLRADSKPGEELITLTGFVPSEQLRQKALVVARLTADKLTLQDRMTVLPQMALPVDVPVEPNQAQIVQNYLEKAAPGLGKTLQLSVDGNGITTVSGRVDEFSDRLKLIRAMQGIPGCTAIRYDLRVCVPMQVQQASVTETRTNSAAPTSSNAGIPPVTVPVVKATTPEPKRSLPAPSVKWPRPPRHVEPTPESARAVSHTASAIVQAGSIEPANQRIEKIAASSLSGLFPPGMSGRSSEPGIILGSPIIVRATYEINLDVNAVPQDLKPDAIKTSDISQTSTSSASPAKLPGQEPVPIPINVMPRLAR